MVHCRPDTEACRSVRIDGRAMFTIVLSSPTMNRLRQQMATTRTRRRGVTTPFYPLVTGHDASSAGVATSHVLRRDPHRRPGPAGPAAVGPLALDDRGRPGHRLDP